MKHTRCIGRNRTIVLVMAGIVAAGCHAAHPPAPAPAPAPVHEPQGAPPKLGAMTDFNDSSTGIRFQYPSDWKPAKGATAVLTVVAPASAAGGGFASLFLDVPKVPGWQAALAAPKSVADGYVDDAKKKRIANASVTSSDVTVAGVAGKDVVLSGKESGTGPGLPAAGAEATEEAIALVHGGKIYIFSCDSDDRGKPAAHAALQAAVKSVQWTH